MLLYFFSTGIRPFGESETMRGMKRRLWRDPVPPRKLRADYPPWLQEVVLRSLEIKPAWRYPSAGQLAFDLRAPDKPKPQMSDVASLKVWLQGQGRVRVLLAEAKRRQLDQEPSVREKLRNAWEQYLLEGEYALATLHAVDPTPAEVEAALKSL